MLKSPDNKPTAKKSKELGSTVSIKTVNKLTMKAPC